LLKVYLSFANIPTLFLSRMLTETPVFLFCLIYGVTVLSPLFKLIIVLFTAATFHFVGKYTYRMWLVFHSTIWHSIKKNPSPIGGVMASMLAWSVVDSEFEPLSSQTKDYEIGICCLSAKHAALRRQYDQYDVSEWGNMSIHRLVSVNYKNLTKCWKLTCSRHDIDEKLNNNHSLTHSLHPQYM
jgi:hypothetical protein